MLTIHRSKGLEFPIVYCPFLWDPVRIADGGEPVFFHDPAAGDRRTIDVGLDSRSFQAHAQQHRLEQRGEELRLAYVALTRARHQAVIWWVGSFDSRHSPLGRLLFAKDAAGDVAPSIGFTPKDSDVVARLRQLAAQAPGAISVERSTLGLPTAWSPPLRAPAELDAAKLNRRARPALASHLLQRHHRRGARPARRQRGRGARRRRRARGAGVGATRGHRRCAAGSAAARARLAVRAVAGRDRVRDRSCTGCCRPATSPRPTWQAELAAQVDAAAALRKLDTGDPGTVVAALHAALQTPLGSIVGDIRLADVRPADRLDELEFELPLAGGDDPSGRLTLTAIAAVLRENLPAHEPMASYAARLEDPLLRATVRGFLTGSIDLVVRLPGPRFAIVDYKTNWLGPPGAALTLSHYRPAALAAEMSRAHYGLQALLYTVALHRYLRWRLAGYDPERHLGAVLYLFLRGMAGADTPAVDGARCGVFGWRPPGALVHALSEVLDRGGPA